MPLPLSTEHVLKALRRGSLAGARELHLTGGLDAFPPEIFGLADTLEVLDLSGGTLTALPDDMGRLTKLRVLFCSGNRFERLPPSLGDCPALSQIGFRATGLRDVPGEALPAALRWLTLTDNAIERLPGELGERPRLQKLMLAGNLLSELPAGLAGAGRLELARLSSNRFDHLPGWLADLPRLAWLSWAGNPVESETAPAGGPEIDWRAIEPGQLLGEGASGRVYRAIWRGPDREGAWPAASRPVACKIFKGAMTSDGLPEREIAACLAAGDHPNLIGALGRLVGHPDRVPGLVLPLVPDGWSALAGPPSLASCSRDIYDPGLRLETASALRLVTDIAAGVAHLHERALLHGDLYGHNILIDHGSGHARLGDFGAASRLPPGLAGRTWQQVEVRAWGLLLGEVLGRCASPPGEALNALQRACVQPDRTARPVMADILAALQAL